MGGEEKPLASGCEGLGFEFFGIDRVWGLGFRV